MRGGGSEEGGRRDGWMGRRQEVVGCLKIRNS